MKEVEIMEIADGEAEGELTGAARDKAEALGELGELVRGHHELAADAVPQKRFDAIWREIDKAIVTKAATEPEPTMVASARGRSVWRRISRWFDRYRGHIITGAVSAGAVAALTLVLRGPSETGGGGGTTQPIVVTPAAYRPTEIESLDTPGGSSSVWQVKDDDGTSTVIWVTPEDTVEGI